jgi:ABC-type sugar transport system ATPase subunit
VGEADLVRLMVGRELQDIYGARPGVDRAGSPRLAVRALTRAGAFADVSFQVWPGEILGWAGLVGAGRTEVGRAIFGAEPPDSGELLLDGNSIRPRTPAEGRRLGIAYVTEDRKEQGLFLRHSVRDNLVAPGLERFAGRADLLRERAIDTYAVDWRRRAQIVSAGLHQVVGRLSGGNQQKVLLASWVGLEPRVVIVDEPTRGVDVGARFEIYSQLRALAAQGTAVLLISSDLQELLGLADRILVMRAGRVVGQCEAVEATEEQIIAGALGTDAPVPGEGSAPEGGGPP